MIPAIPAIPVQFSAASNNTNEWLFASRIDLHQCIVRDGLCSCADHEGTRTGRIQTWDGKKWNIASDWITADDSIIAPMVKEAAAKYAAEKKLTPGCLVTN